MSNAKDVLTLSDLRAEVDSLLLGGSDLLGRLQGASVLSRLTAEPCCS